jgi:hypothetical protein
LKRRRNKRRGRHGTGTGPGAAGRRADVATGGDSGSRQSGSAARRGDRGGAGNHEGAETRPGTLAGDGRRYLDILLIVAAFAAVLLRLAYLRADPPVGLSWSQALFTDGARAIDAARSRILYGDWGTHTASPVLLFYPIPNLLAYLIYGVGGVGLAQANLTGVLPGLATVGLAYHFMLKSTGKVAALVALATFAVPYAYVMYTRTPLLESLQIFMLMAAFVLLLRGTVWGSVSAGMLVGAAALMVKLHALHFGAVALGFLILAGRVTGEDFPAPRRLGLFFVAGAGIALAVWLAAVYSIDPDAVTKYFESNVLTAQSADYEDMSLTGLAGTRLRALFHVGSGLDGFFRKLPVLSTLAVLGLISTLSGLTRSNRSLRPWELLAAVWFVLLIAALSVLSYRPLRYFIPLIPSMCLLAASVIIRLIRGEPLLHARKPRWFTAAFFIWLVWVLIHVQHDVIFHSFRPDPRGYVTSTQQALLKYDLAIVPQVLVIGGLAVGVLLLAGRRLKAAQWRFRRPVRKNLVLAAVGGLVLLNIAKFGDYCMNRKHTIIDMAESLERVTSGGVFLVGDCATTLSLEAGFRSLPTYGVLIQRGDYRALEQQPITHFLIRFPTLYEFLTSHYPGFEQETVPVGRYRLCGRDATVIRFEEWPGYPVSYAPSEFEDGMLRLSRGHVDTAAGLFRSFLEDHPDSYEAMLGLAVCLSVSGDIGAAWEMLDEAIEIAPAGALEYHVYRDILDALLNEGGTGR